MRLEPPHAGEGRTREGRRRKSIHARESRCATIPPRAAFKQEPQRRRTRAERTSSRGGNKTGIYHDIWRRGSCCRPRRPYNQHSEATPEEGHGDERTPSTAGKRAVEGARRVDSGCWAESWGTARRRVAERDKSLAERQQLTSPASVVGDIRSIVGGIWEVLVRERVCFQKGCATNVRRSRMGSFANSSTQKPTLPTGHLRVREVLKGPTEKMGAPHTDDLGRNTCPGYRVTHVGSERRPKLRSSRV